MGNIIIPFKSRSDATRLYSGLIAKGVMSSLIGTPPMYGKSCGLSVVLPEKYRDTAVEFIRTMRLSSVVGIYIR